MFAIPKIHQLWVGPRPIPARIQAYCETVKKAFPGWEYKLWREKDMESIAARSLMPEVVLGKQAWLNQSLGLGIRSDILRLEILRLEGGVYFDSDYEALRPDCGPLFDGIEGFVYSDQRLNQPGIGVLGSSKIMDPMVVAYLNAAKKRFAKPADSGKVLHISGPRLFVEVLKQRLDKTKHIAEQVEKRLVRLNYPNSQITAFAFEVMHPYDWKKLNWASFKPEAYPWAWMAHHWAGSWK